MVKIKQISVRGFDNNFSYLVTGDGIHSNEGVLIDPTGNAETIENEISKNKLKILLQIFTHSHPDHCELLEYFQKKGIPQFIPKEKPLGAVEKLEVAGMKINIIHTPGHTKESVCFLIENNLFTGDTLLVKGVGTTRYGGDEKLLDNSLQLISTLNEKTTLWPGHAYGGNSSTLGEALANSHIRPSPKTHELIKKKVEEYESKSGSKKKF